MFLSASQSLNLLVGVLGPYRFNDREVDWLLEICVCAGDRKGGQVLGPDIAGKPDDAGRIAKENDLVPTYPGLQICSFAALSPSLNVASLLGSGRLTHLSSSTVLSACRTIMVSSGPAWTT